MTATSKIGEVSPMGTCMQPSWILGEAKPVAGVRVCRGTKQNRHALAPVRVCSLLVSLSWVVFLLSPVAASAQDVSGVWIAEIEAPTGSAQLTLQLDEGFGLMQTTYLAISSPDMTRRVDIEQFMRSGMDVSFSADIMSFEGSSEGHDTLEGTLHYEGQTYQVAFRKTGDLTADPSSIVDEPRSINQAEEMGGDAGVGWSGVGTSNTSEPASMGPNYWPLAIWFGFWCLAGVLLWRKFRSRPGIEKEADGVSTESETNVAIDALLPIVRFGRRWREKKRGLAVAGSGLVLFKRRRKFSAAALQAMNDCVEMAAYDGIRKVVVVPDESVERIEVQKPSMLGWSSIRVVTKKRAHRLAVPAYELPNLITALRTRFHQRLDESTPIRFHAWPLIILLVLGTLLVAWIAGPASSSVLISTQSEMTQLEKSLLVAGGGLTLLLVVFSIPLVLVSADHLPSASTVPGHKNTGPDLSRRKPFRSRSMAIALKIVAVLLFGAFVKWSFLPPAASASVLQEIGARIAGTSWYVMYAMIGVLLSLSHSLAQRAPAKLGGRGAKTPILYLRSFADDRETTLNRRSMLSTLMGVEPPYYLIDQYEVGSRTSLHRLAKKLIRWLYRFHPLFLVRLILGQPNETSEQQLGAYFKHHGQFVAIGRPGERFVTTGAARMFVTNEEWQQTVLDLMEESNFVVLQPSRTEGVWWEVEQVFNKLEPGKILLSLVNYHGFQNDYETFRARMAGRHPERPPLPPSIGNEPRVTFVVFDEDWTPRVLPLAQYFLPFWPIRGTTANLKKTIGAYVAGAAT